jgi:acyl-[acyl-carrier-protein]-phospholipid O-acyltransferase/long-chain-fatty-acid--[acyl-carrier-protein] ligase
VVCQAVQKLSAEGAIARARKRRPCHRQFIYVAARHPFRPCLIDSSRKGQDLSYARALAGSMILTKALRPVLGDAPMVGVWLPPSSGGALANIALAFLGKTSVNLNYSISADVVRSSLRQCAIRHVLTSRRFTDRLPLDPGPGVELVYLEDFASRVGKWQRLRTFLTVVLLPAFVLERWILRLGGHKQDDLATVIFSSGSTGDPKGVMLTHGNVAANVESIVQGTGLAAQDSILGVLPFFHSFGYTVTLWAPLQLGMSVVYHADPRAAREIGELCRDYRCTVYVTTPTFLRFCLRKCEPTDFASLHFLICGAEKLPASLAQDFHKKFGVMPLEGYGCTELAPVASANLPDEPIDGYLEVNNKLGSIGPPLPGIAARIHHPETLAPQPPGEEGLLFVLGANVMKGYLNRPDLTAASILEGWYNTGDVGRIDDDGYVTLTGRLSRFAKSGGEMVPLQRVEEELHDVLGTSELVCGVTCVPDEARGERLAVLYVPQQLEPLGRDVRGWLQGLSGRGLPSIWMPVERDFYPVEAIPVLGSGKIDLRRLKEMALEVTGKK